MAKIGSATPLPRRSLGTSPLSSYASNSIGTEFPFVNREQASEEIIQAFNSQYIARAKGWSAKKREIIIPLCMGLAGIGKSTAARKAVRTYLQDKKYDDDDFLCELSTADVKCNFQLGKIVFDICCLKPFLCFHRNGQFDQ